MTLDSHQKALPPLKQRLDGIFRALLHPVTMPCSLTAIEDQEQQPGHSTVQQQHHAGCGTVPPTGSSGRGLSPLTLQFSSFLIHSLHAAARDISGRDPDEELCLVFVTLEFPVKFI